MTTLDYPGKLAAIVFTYGCDMRCPYCHNPELVSEPLNRELVYSSEDVLGFMKKRVGKLDALVITGGEPSLYKDLEDFIREVRELGFLIKLDTNGGSPERVESIIGEGIVDYWAMDVKFGGDLYEQGLGGGRSIPVGSVQSSAKQIMESGADYEFRTTVMKGMHDEDAMHQIGRMIEGAKVYYIQNFRAGKTIDPELNSRNSFKEDELMRFKDIMEGYVNEVVIR